MSLIQWRLLIKILSSLDVRAGIRFITRQLWEVGAKCYLWSPVDDNVSFMFKNIQEMVCHWIMVKYPVWFRIQFTLWFLVRPICQVVFDCWTRRAARTWWWRRLSLPETLSTWLGLIEHSLAISDHSSTTVRSQPIVLDNLTLIYYTYL